MRQSGEPSVEEILESIKKVIARDNREEAADERRQRETRGVAPAAPAPEADYDDEDDHEDVLDLGDAEALSPPEPEAAAAVPELVTEDTRAAMRGSLAALAMLAEPGARPQIVRSGETSLEALTRELLRPALAQWLETNLPPLVEKMVAAEIARIVGKKV